MNINDIVAKSNKKPITDIVHQLSAEEINCIVDTIKEIRGTLSNEHQYNLRVENLLENKSLTANKNKPCVLKYKFISQDRYGFDPFEDTGEQGLVTISIKDSYSSDFTVVKQSYINSNEELTYDCSSYLTSGANQVMISVEGQVTKENTPALIYSVRLTSLSISADNFAWWTPYSDDFVIPFIISGNISKKLVVKVFGDNYERVYETDLGKSVYTETALNFVIAHPNQVGTFTIEAYLTNNDNTIKTDAVSFNVMCYSVGSTAKMIVLNKVNTNIMNWSENEFFAYSVFDGNNVYSDISFQLTKDTTTIFSSDERVEACKAHLFKGTLEIDTIDNNDFDVVINAFDSEKSYGEFTFNVNNSIGYGAEAGAVYYINPKKRSNNQANKNVLINEISGEEMPCTWNNVAFASDGWAKDENGYGCLRLMSESSLDTLIKPFEVECNKTGKTIEFDYCCDNVVDTSEPIISCFTPTDDGFVGFKITPDQITVHTQQLSNDNNQSIGTDFGVRIRAAISVIPNVDGFNGFNICYISINGVKVREFCYSPNDCFAQDASIVIGSNFADLDIYGIRIYDNGLTSTALLKNYINLLANNVDKDKVREDNDILDEKGSGIDFHNTVDQYNCFVFDKPFPSKTNPAAVIGNLQFYWKTHPEHNVIIQNVEASGQGTSSMKYWDWNQRWKLGSSTVVVTPDGKSTKSKTVKLFDGVPKMSKITAKKNWASPMQSHKLGSVNSYQDLYKQMGLSNEAMEEDYEVRVSVYQEPILGFYKYVDEEGQEIYEYMGEFTVGPDKGDKYCFGYDADTYPDMLSIEGSDNAPLCSLFRVPWNPKKDYIKYNEEEKAFQYNGTNSWDWDFSDVPTTNISKFINPYNVAYFNSNRILPFNGTVEQLNEKMDDSISNADVPIAKEKFDELFPEPTKYKSCGFDLWCNDYNLYYYEAAEGEYIVASDGESDCNMKTSLSISEEEFATIQAKSKAEQNDIFIQKRIAKFRNDAPSYWDINDCLFSDNWVELNAGTDNRAKNTYPYSFGNLFRWRMDDTDTIFPIDNQGQLSKPYWVEMTDIDAAGAPYWNGVTSNFWNLLGLAFPEEKAKSMRKMLQCMEDLSPVKSGTHYERLFGFYIKYYFNTASYFPITAINADSKRYELAKRKYDTGEYRNDTDPITQWLGDCKSTEEGWVKRRIIYITSKYQFGDFGNDSNETIICRAAGNDITYNIKPAFWMYPTVSNGTSVVTGARTQPREVCSVTVNLGGSKDQQNAINGCNWLLDIGEWHDKTVQGTMIVAGKMLKRLALGSKTEQVKIAITNLSVGGCYLLSDIILSNISTLQGELNLENCSHIQKVHMDGTSISNVIIPNGAPLTEIEYSDKTKYVKLRNHVTLSNEGVKLSDTAKTGVTDIFVDGCPQLDALDMVRSVMKQQASDASDHKLKRIRITNIDNTYDDQTEAREVLRNVAALANGEYAGLDVDGYENENYKYPVLDGRIYLNCNAYKNIVETIQTNFPLLKFEIGGSWYIGFADPEAERVFAQKYGDGVAVTPDDADAVTKLSCFRNNRVVQNIVELGEFHNLTEIEDYAFQGCTNLTTCLLPKTITKLGYCSFNDCTKLTGEIDLPNLKDNYSSRYCFKNTKITKVKDLGKITYIPDHTFGNCYALEEVNIPSTCNRLSNYCFASDKENTTLKTINGLENIVKFDSYCLQGVTGLKLDLAFNPNLTYLGHYALGYSTNRIIKIRGGIPQSVTYVGDGVFTRADIDEAIIDLPNLTYLSGTSFSYSNITEVKNLGKITNIDGGKEYGAFYGCKNLTKVTLPDTLTMIIAGAFGDCTSLSKLVCLAIRPPELSMHYVLPFHDCDNIKFYVQNKSILKYKSASNWPRYASKIFPLTDVLATTPGVELEPSNIVFDGNSYINTDYEPRANTNIEIKARCSNNDVNRVLFGECTDYGNTDLYYLAFAQYGMIEFARGGNSDAQFNFSLNTDYVCKFKDGKTYVDDVEQKPYDNTKSTDSSHTIYLGAMNYAGVAYNNFVGSVEYMKIYEDETLVKHFVGTLDGNGTPCFFEMIEGKMYYNQGTGTLTEE